MSWFTWYLQNRTKQLYEVSYLLDGLLRKGLINRMARVSVLLEYCGLNILDWGILRLVFIRVLCSKWKPAFQVRFSGKILNFYEIIQ